jgi:hypothetical protein
MLITVLPDVDVVTEPDVVTVKVAVELVDESGTTMVRFVPFGMVSAVAVGLTVREVVAVLAVSAEASVMPVDGYAVHEVPADTAPM